MGVDSTVLWTLVTLALVVIAIVVLAIYFFVVERKEKPVSGRHALLGEIGVARTDINPEGRVLVHGEWWNARANEHIPVGAKVRVVEANKMVLKVERAPDDA